MSESRSFLVPTTLPPPTHCRWCDAPIRWANSVTTDKPSPIDAEPSETGNCHVFSIRNRLVFHVLGKATERAAAVEHGTPLYTNHFQTCPDREQWRR